MKDGGGHIPFQKLRFAILSLPLCESASLSVAVEELTPLLDTSGDREDVGGSINVLEDSSGVSMVMFCGTVSIRTVPLLLSIATLNYFGLCQNTSCSVL